MPDQRDWAAILLRHGYSGVKKIGEGSFGVAVLVQDDDGTKAVCKLVDVSRASPKETQEARREGRLLSQVKHPYIVRYRENFADRGWLGIIMDFCDGGDITAQINAAAKRHETLDEPTQVVRWFTQSMLAIKYLHSKHILHRDLKPSNIFLTKAGDARLGDFGISKVMQCTKAFAKTFVGTPYYLSPEVISESPYSWPADIWSMGCILYQLCTLRVPFEAKNIADLAQKICGGKIPVIPDGFSDPVREVCQEMMSRRPADRPTADKVIDAQFAQDMVRKLLEEAREPEEPKAKVRHEILDQFQCFDRNGDGVIDRQELSLVLKHLDASVWTDENVDQVLQVADKNQDGRIQFDEFLLWAFGCDERKGLAEQTQEHIAEVHAAVDSGDVSRLSASLLAWRQAVDLGCLRVSPPEASVRSCEALTSLCQRGGSLLDGDEPTSTPTCYRLVRQMRAVLQAVEQLLSECARPHIQRVAAVSAPRGALRGLVFERADGARRGICPGGLGDEALEAAGARWYRLVEGERLVELSGNALSAARTSRRPSPEPLPRKGSRASARARSSSPGPAEEPSKAAGDDGLAACVRLRTSEGRVLELGSKTRCGETFSFSAAEGEEIENATFAGKKCTGISCTPLVVSWPKKQEEEVRSAFQPAADAVWSMLLRLSFRMGSRQGKFALLEAKRLGLPHLPVPPEMQEKVLGQCREAKPPSHWDLSLLGSLAPTYTAACQVPLGKSDVALLQGILSACYTRPQQGDAPPSQTGDSTEEGEPLLPQNLELVKAFRLQNWQAWARFSARREEIRAHQADQSSDDEGDPARANKAKSSFHSRGVLEALGSLGIGLDKDVGEQWLFHGLSTRASEDVESPDFDIARAGPESGRLYGRGCYFSETSSKVDQHFQADDEEGLRCLLLCRVALGRMLVDEALLPDVVQLVEQCTSGSFHSVLGDRRARCHGCARDFVVYDTDQVYPEFLLWYRRVYDTS